MPSSENHIATIETGLSGEEILARLEGMSKRGKLAGYERPATSEDGSDASFAAHGSPFDGVVLVRAGQGRVEFELSMPRKMPVIFAVILVLTVWPGLPITEAFMHSFVWYENLIGSAEWLSTWVWYLPLTIIPAPFAWLGAVRKSRATSMEHARETVERVRVVLAGS